MIRLRAPENIAAFLVSAVCVRAVVEEELRHREIVARCRTCQCRTAFVRPTLRIRIGAVLEQRPRYIQISSIGSDDEGSDVQQGQGRTPSGAALIYMRA